MFLKEEEEGIVADQWRQGAARRTEGTTERQATRQRMGIRDVGSQIVFERQRGGVQTKIASGLGPLAILWGGLVWVGVGVMVACCLR